VTYERLYLDEDDQLLMRGDLWIRMTNCWCRVVDGVEVVGLGLGIMVLLMKQERLPGGCFFFFFFSNVGFLQYLFFLYFFSWLLALFKVHYINIRKLFYFFNVGFETL
jgi:hypothetical protein